MPHTLTRRDWLRTATACSIAAATGTALTAQPKAEPFRLNYILGSSLFGMLPLADILPAVAQTGCDQIDLWPKIHANQREQVEEMGHQAFRDLLAKHNVTVGMSTRYDLGPFQLQDEISFLHNFKGRLIVTGAKNVEGATLKDRVRTFIEKLQPTVALAEKHGVAIAIENHANSLIESPDSIRYFAEFAKSKHLGIALAPYHLPQDPKLLADLIRDLGPRLLHFYAWEHGHGAMSKLPKQQELQQLPHMGPLDFQPIISALKEIQFAGWTEIFMHPYPRGLPILEGIPEIVDTLNASRSYLDGLLTSA